MPFLFLEKARKFHFSGMNSLYKSKVSYEQKKYRLSRASTPKNLLL